MRHNPLGLVFKNSAYLLLHALPATAATMPKQADFLDVCGLYRRMGCALLLMQADPRPFYTCLFRSARAFVYFYEHAPATEKVLSRALPVFDAIACRDDEGARRLAQLAPDSFNPRREYEEGFLYLRILLERFFLGADSAALQPRLARFEELTREFPDPRLNLCRALLAADQAALDAALEELIQLESAALTKRLENDQLPPDEAPVARVSVEVLAWLELAERAGLTVASDYPLAPGVARLFHRAKFADPERWRDAGSLLDDLA